MKFLPKVSIVLIAFGVITSSSSFALPVTPDKGTADLAPPTQTQPTAAPSRDLVKLLTPTDDPVKGHWGTGPSELISCMGQLNGYYYRLVADNFQQKLVESNFDEPAREELSEDLASVVLAIDPGRVIPADPQSPDRWRKWLESAEEVQIQDRTRNYEQDVRADCQRRFGGGE